MDRHLFAAEEAGRVIRTRTGYDAFIPENLPPEITWDARIARALETASRAMGEANAILHRGTYLDLLLAREACCVAIVEGQPTSPEEVFAARATNTVASRGTRLALNYTGAFRHVEARLEEMPLSLRLVREAHHLLSQGLEHSGSYPGQFRRSQNWLGPEGCSLSDATLVPPPVGEMKASLDNWERYLHTTDPLPSTVKVASLHYQFEIIRPFLEYNDAALLAVMPFMLRELGLVESPLPVIAAFVRRRLQEYQQRMLDVCQRGAWSEWLSFYLFGIAGALRETIEVVRHLDELRSQCVGLLENCNEIVWRAMEASWRQPVLNVSSASVLMGSNSEEAAQALSELAALGIIRPRGQSPEDEYSATEVIAALDRGPVFDGGYPPFF